MIFYAIKSDGFKEYILPNADNTDCSVYLDQAIFSLKKSVRIRFEVVHGSWSIIASSNEYELIYHKQSVPRVMLQGRELVTIKTASDEVIKGLTFNSELKLTAFEKFSVKGMPQIRIGKDAENDIIYDFYNLVSKNHCVIVKSGRTAYVNDLSSNGVYVNNNRVRDRKAISFGDSIEVFGLRMIYLGDILALCSHTGRYTVSDSITPFTAFGRDECVDHVHHSVTFFNRAPRMFPSIASNEIVIEPPTSPQITKKKSLLMTIGPSFTMAIPMILGVFLMIFAGGITSPFMFMGLITAIGSAILGAVWALLNIRESNRREIEDETQRFNLYGNYLIEMGNCIKNMYIQNYNAIHLMYPSSSDCCKYNETSKQLWTRNYTHSDFLFFRLGLGNIPFQANIKIPSEKFSMVYDSLKDKPTLLYEHYETLYRVPVGVDLSQSNLYGIAGGKNKEGVYTVVNNLIVQIAASISYTDAKIIFCFNGSDHEQKKNFDYIKWLPHTWSKDKKMRFYATNRQEASDVFFELSEIIRQRAEISDTDYRQKLFTPHYFLFVSDIELFEGELISKYVFDRDSNFGITTFIMTDSYQNLPNSCENIIQNDASFRGAYNVFRNQSEAISFEYDRVETEELEAFAKRLSGIVVKEVEDNTELASSVTFLDMYGVHSLRELNAAELWRKNRTYNTMRVLIGKKAGGADCYLDIHEKHHGPHGLVAGTTGSGKSEMIQTFILSLAINYSPDDIELFIIDFKGGGMANLFSDLPHLVGQISNLSGNQIRRAMVSIKSENLRRQKIFGEYGVNNINHYTQLYKNGKAALPIPHLLIIIDEFAELKKEEPDFMRELISVAQVGRSLGVHLILATQKPSGTVDDNIWSNAKFRICLRVQDRQDSNDMLHNPDAAFITQAGRGFLQVGNNELYEQFQSGWSGAVYDENIDLNKSEIVTMITPTGKTALVGSHNKMKWKEEERLQWYTFLYNAVREYAGRPGEDDEHLDDEAVFGIITKANQAGFNIGKAATDFSAVRNFAALMPKDDMEPRRAVDYILLMALQNHTKLPELKEKTQLEVVVEYLNALAKAENYTRKEVLWLPLLRRNIALSQLVNLSQMYANGTWTGSDRLQLSAVVGEYDDPQNQTQLPFTVNFSDGGHLAVCGTVVSGKSTFLQTLIFSMAMKYRPDIVNFYILDYSGGMLSALDRLPHTGGVVTDSDTDRIEKFFNMIEKIIAERKKLLNGGNYSQYVKSGKDTMAAIFVVIDNFAGFKEKTENAYEEILIRLSREGVGYGIFLILSSAGFGLSEIQSRIGDNFKTVVSLEMGDKFKYMDVLRTSHIEVIPESGIKGRGIGYVDGRILEFQTAVAVPADDDYKRNSKIAEICTQMAAGWSGARPRPIPSIPENPTVDDLSALEEYRAMLNDPSVIPYAYNSDDASVYGVQLSRTYCYMINGRKRTGKTNVLKLLIAGAVHKPGQKIIIEQSATELENYVPAQEFRYLSSDRDIFDYFNELTPQFVERNRYKKELAQQGYSDEEIFAEMQRFEPVYIFIADFSSFMNSIYHPSDGIQSMSGFFENIFEKGYMHQVFFFTCINTDDAANFAGLKAYSHYVSYKTGVHLGGNLSSQRIFNFQNIHFSVLSKQMKKGEGFVPDADDDTKALKIIIPYCGGRT